MKLKCEIEVKGEPAAGLVGYTDTIWIIVDSGNPGGEDGDFEASVVDFLLEWYGADSKVTVKRT